MNFLKWLFGKSKIKQGNKNADAELLPTLGDENSKAEINKFLDNLSADWEPIKGQATKYFDNYSRLREDGAAQISRRPWVAPLNFGLLIFPPVNKSWLDEFHTQTNIKIPLFYRDILLQVNGCFVYDFSLYGLPKSIYTTGILDRSYLQQYDLGTANMYWKHEYKVDNSLFYIGGRHYSFDENLGYFLNGNQILSVRKNGEILNTWATFKDFLFEEINVAEEHMIKQKGS